MALLSLSVGVALVACAAVEAPAPTQVADAAPPTGVLAAAPTDPPATPTLDLPVEPRVGALAPEVLLPDLAGNEVSLNGLRGNLVLLNFWTTW